MRLNSPPGRRRRRRLRSPVHRRRHRNLSQPTQHPPRLGPSAGRKIQRPPDLLAELRSPPDRLGDLALQGTRETRRDGGFLSGCSPRATRFTNCVLRSPADVCLPPPKRQKIPSGRTIFLSPRHHLPLGNQGLKSISKISMAYELHRVGPPLAVNKVAKPYERNVANELWICPSTI